MNWKIAFAILAGAPLIFVAAICRAWTEPNYSSIKPWPAGAPNSGPYRPRVSEWSWTWLNYWYANSEDGVTGQEAWIWDGNNVLVPYPSTFPSWMPKWCIAWAWSAWRNNANNLKRPSFHPDINTPWSP